MVGGGQSLSAVPGPPGWLTARAGEKKNVPTGTKRIHKSAECPDTGGGGPASALPGPRGWLRIKKIRFLGGGMSLAVSHHAVRGPARRGPSPGQVGDD